MCAEDCSRKGTVQREAWLLREPAGILMPVEYGGKGTARFPASSTPHPPTHPTRHLHTREDMNVSPGMLRSHSLPRNSPWGYDWLTAFNTESFLINKNNSAKTLFPRSTSLCSSH